MVIAGTCLVLGISKKTKRKKESIFDAISYKKFWLILTRIISSLYFFPFLWKSFLIRTDKFKDFDQPLSLLEWPLTTAAQWNHWTGCWWVNGKSMDLQSCCCLYMKKFFHQHDLNFDILYVKISNFSHQTKKKDVQFLKVINKIFKFSKTHHHDTSVHFSLFDR